MPDVSVIVVNWNTRELLQQCLASLENGLRPGMSCETWVVDNASRDGSTEMVRAMFPDVHLIENSENVGFASANNLALARMTSRYALLLNSDCRVLDTAIAGMVDYLDHNPGAGAVGCRLLNADKTVQRSAWKAFPTLASVASGGLWLDKLPGLSARLAREERMYASAEQATPAAHLLGACLMVRRAAIDKTGPLDSSYFMYFEETDWCQRLHADGWSVWYLPSHSIIHYGQQSAALAPDKATADWCRSMCRFYRRTYTPNVVNMAALKYVISASVILRFVVSRLRHRGRALPTWRGVCDALRAIRAG